MYYDLHIHSCLSPCGNDEMTINNICNMALIKGLDLISITDHNSTLNSNSLKIVSEKIGIKVIYGVEIQTIEEVHVLGYFKTLIEIEEYQKWLEKKLIKTKNSSEYFGNQFIVDENDLIVDVYDNLLIMSLNCDIEECCKIIHQFGGKVVLAHVIDKSNGICNQLGFIPENLDFDGIEIKNYEQKEKVQKRHPWINHTLWFINSDAHQLIDISEKVNFIKESTLEEFWR